MALYTEVVMSISGLDESSSAQSLEEALCTMPGIRNTKVSLQEEEATVIIDESTSSNESVIAEIASMGYKASIKRQSVIKELVFRKKDGVKEVTEDSLQKRLSFMNGVKSYNLKADLDQVTVLINEDSVDTKIIRQNHVPFSNVLKLVQFLFCLPGTNAATERVFSQVNNIWTSDKTQVALQTVKAM